MSQWGLACLVVGNEHSVCPWNFLLTIFYNYCVFCTIFSPPEMRELDQSHKEISAEIQEVWADYYNFPLLFSEIMQKDFKHRVIPRLTVRNAKNTAYLLCCCCCPVTFSSLNEPHTCVVQGLPLLLFVSSLLVFCLQNSLNLDEFHPVARFLTKLWFGSYLLCFQVLQLMFQRQKFAWITILWSFDCAKNLNNVDLWPLYQDLFNWVWIEFHL